MKQESEACRWIEYESEFDPTSGKYSVVGIKRRDRFDVSGLDLSVVPDHLRDADIFPELASERSTTSEEKEPPPFVTRIAVFLVGLFFGK